VLQEQAAGAFDAVFIAIGAHLAKHVEIPARDAVKVLGAVSLLSDCGKRRAPCPGPQSRRLWRRQHGDGRRQNSEAFGSDRDLIVYRRDQVHMSATEFETDEASAEGIKIKWLRSIQGDSTATISRSK